MDDEKDEFTWVDMAEIFFPIGMFDEQIHSKIC